MKTEYTLMAIALLMIFGCSPEEHHHEQHEHAEESHSFTVWTDNTEAFVEITPVFAGEAAEAIIHLTQLSDYSPISDATVTLGFFGDHREPQRVLADEHVRPGIVVGHFSLPTAGVYQVELEYSTDALSERLPLGHIEVFANEHEFENNAHGHQEDHAHLNTEVVHLFKEQQWNMEFATQPAHIRPMFSSILAIAEVVPNQHGYAEVVAPVDGLLRVEENQSMAVPGKQVKKGEALVVLYPPIGASNTLLDRQLNYQRAKREFERAERLLDREAISLREYEQIRQTFEIEKANYETLLNTYGVERQLDGDENRLTLKAPIEGVVSRVSVLPGQNVSAGENLMTIIDPSIVWIRVQFYEKDMLDLGDPVGLLVRVPGTNQQFEFSPSEFKLLSKGLMLDVQSRTIPLLVQVNNPNNQLKIGQVLQVEIHTEQQKQALAVHVSDVIDEEIDKIVFVQIEGEAFERRVVQTGPSFENWVSITDGLQAGERVVTRGAYAVKLAGANTGMGSAHVH